MAWRVRSTNPATGFSDLMSERHRSREAAERAAAAARVDERTGSSKRLWPPLEFTVEPEPTYPEES